MGAALPVHPLHQSTSVPAHRATLCAMALDAMIYGPSRAASGSPSRRPGGIAPPLTTESRIGHGTSSGAKPRAVCVTAGGDHPAGTMRRDFTTGKKERIFGAVEPAKSADRKKT